MWGSVLLARTLQSKGNCFWSVGGAVFACTKSQNPRKCFKNEGVWAYAFILETFSWVLNYEQKTTKKNVFRILAYFWLLLFFVCVCALFVCFFLLVYLMLLLRVAVVFICLLFVYLLLCSWAFSSEVIISILLTHIKENFAKTNKQKLGFRFFIIHLKSNTTSSSV